jgi:signal transduction histidine kinase
MTLSLTNRLRIGFAVLAVLLTAVSVLGVGRLFQVRERFEDQSARYFSLQLGVERVRSAFLLEQSALASHVGASRRSAREAFDRAAAASTTATREARRLAGDEPRAIEAIDRRAAAEAEWRRQVAKPVLDGKRPRPQAESNLTRSVVRATDAVTATIQDLRARSRQRSHDDTSNVVILVVVGLAGALLAAIVLFSGLVTSMRAPLSRLVDGARRLAGGDLRTRVDTGGPSEIATLGEAFNDMATALERDARERDRVEQMKDDFLLTVSHELRTPVTSVKGFAEMLAAQENSLSASQREAIDAISEGTGDLSSLIDDLVDLARSDAGRLRIEPRPTAVRPLLDRMARQLRPAFAERGQKLQVSTPKDLPQIKADPERISQVLANLLSNANKYADEDSTVRLSAERDGRRVAIAVTDDGPGMSADELDHAFERFWRADSGVSQRVGGTGLGLAIAKSLVELHGGEIAASSSADGTSFRFTLPVTRSRAAPPPRARSGGRG